MKAFKQLLSLSLALIIICGAFSVVPFAAETGQTVAGPEDGTYAPGQVIVMFKDGAINTDTTPDKGGFASTGASFGEGMRAVSSEDAALSSAGGTADILSDSLGEDFALEDTLVFPDADKDDGGLAATGASSDAPGENGLTVALVSSEKYDTATMIEKLGRNKNIAAVEPNQYIRLTDHADYSLNDTYNSYLYNLNSPAARNIAGDSVNDRGADPESALSLNASDAWKKLDTGDEEIVIAVVDTGVLDTHEDLQDKMWINPGNIGLEGRSGYNFLGNNTEYYDDDEGHGSRRQRKDLRQSEIRQEGLL